MTSIWRVLIGWIVAQILLFLSIFALQSTRVWIQGRPITFIVAYLLISGLILTYALGGNKMFGWLKRRDPTIPTNLPQLNDWLLELHNTYRSKHGRPAIHLDSMCRASAQDHAQWMARKGVLQHEPNTIENIGRGYLTVDAVEEGWEKSPEHERNILSNRFVGFGMAMSSKGEYFWCARYSK